MTTGILRLIASATGPAQRGLVERRQHDAGDAAADEALDFGDLRVAVVLAERTAPDDSTPSSFAGLVRAGMDALPELVRRPLRDDGDRQRRVPARACRLLRQAANAQQRGDSNH